MQGKTQRRAGGTDRNHHEPLVRVHKPTQGLRVKSNLKAGFTHGVVQPSGGGSVR
jgi:hypothetical protein